MFMRCFVLAFLIMFSVSSCQVGDGSEAVVLAKAPLSIVSQGKTHRFTVEVAQTPDQQQRGLMFRESLAPTAGMLFPLSPAREVSFWMKDTVIPLDIVFIRADGSIARIAANTIPYSGDRISSGEPVAAVLELAGGRAADLGIDEDDVVTWQKPGWL
ncbi:MAG: DUF192 domain-containing protein [Sphingomonadaceae bacterium]